VIKQRDAGKRYIMRNFVLCKSHEMIFRWSTEGEGTLLGTWRIWGRREFYVEFWWKNLQGKDHTEEPVQYQ